MLDTVTAQNEIIAEPSAIDRLTGGAISAQTSSARVHLIKLWLESTPQPSYEQMKEVFKLLSAKDKGAARHIKERMELIKKGQLQEAQTLIWSNKAQELLASPKLSIADALAWQRDAAKDGAPISKEPLASLRGLLAERVKTIEDLQHRAQVQREAAVLLAQRIEVLSTKFWEESLAQEPTLQQDIQLWRTEQENLLSQPEWISVDPRHTPALQSSAEHLQLVWQAFSAALKQAALSSTDPSQPLPAVPAWADQIRQKRGDALSSERGAGELKKSKKSSLKDADPALKAQARQSVLQCMNVLEKELSEGHGKASTGAANDLRQALKEHADFIDERLDKQAQLILAAAGELAGWQRWRADQIRAELVQKAEGLLQRAKPSVQVKSAKIAKDPQPTELSAAPLSSDQAAEAGPHLDSTLSPAQEELSSEESTRAEQAPEQVLDKSPTLEAGNEDDAPSSNATSSAKASSAKNKPSADYVPTMGPRKLQETLRKLREEWKQTDQGGQPNHALWKRFDHACNLAYPFVQEWLQQTKAQSQANRTQRMELIAELKAWSQSHSFGPDWRVVQRQLHDFAERWRACGHVSEKVYTELQALWKDAMHQAHEPLETLQSKSIANRRALIEESKALGAQAVLKIDLIKALQQRWQDESQVVPIDRKLAQRLWEEFKKPIDEAFQRKSAARAQQAQALSAHDQAVLEASKALEKAIELADAHQIKLAMQHLQAVSVQAPQSPSNTQAQPIQPPAESASGDLSDHSREVQAHSTEDAQLPVPAEQPAQDSSAQVDDKPVAPKPAKVVLAVRGDDRPGAKSTAHQAHSGADNRTRNNGFSSQTGRDSRAGKEPRAGFKDKKDSTNTGGRDARFARDARTGKDVPRGPRLGDAAFRAQRQALEAAESAMRKLAAQAHGQTLTHLMAAWQEKNPELIPSLKELGPRVNAAQRSAWLKAVQESGSGAKHSESLLRLEMAADTPTPASDLQARRNLQLQLLTKRHDPAPLQTWAQDTASVLASSFDAEVAKRLQAALKVLLKH
jgi:hypothetical protein